MKATTLFRIAAVIFLLFAVGHTFGFLSFVAPTEEGRAVFEAMNRVHFTADSREYSYGNWYRGFGLSATVSMLFQAFLAWYLGSMAGQRLTAARTLGWALFVAQLPGLVMAWMYYGIPPLVLSGLLTIVLGATAWLAKPAP